jgi:hypothetical protein
MPERRAGSDHDGLADEDFVGLVDVVLAIDALRAQLEVLALNGHDDDVLNSLTAQKAFHGNLLSRRGSGLTSRAEHQIKKPGRLLHPAVVRPVRRVADYFFLAIAVLSSAMMR